MRDIITELKALRLHGMAATWAELGEQNNAEVERSRWLVEHMLKAEASDRATRSVTHQMATVIQLSLLATTSWSLSLLPLLFAVAVSLVFYRLGDRLAGQYPEAAFRRLLGMFLSLMAAFLVVRATIGT